jgi:hypothetical protein
MENLMALPNAGTESAIPVEEAKMAVLSVWGTMELSVNKDKAITVLRDCDLYPKKSGFAQAVLTILEQSLSTNRGMGGNGFSNWEGSCTVEHILPQDPNKQGAGWLDGQKGCWTEKKHGACLHKLGNLCLLNQSDNSKVRNSGFEEKLKILVKEGGGQVTSSATARTLVNFTKWTPRTYAKRHQELLEKLAKRWSICMDQVNQGLTGDGKSI